MSEFWESCFNEIQTAWGFEPADSAILAKDFFLRNNAHEILIPGIGYGRNAGIFCDNGFNVTGIEISKTAIELAKSKNKLKLKIYHGSVTGMPFDKKIYDGIFCYALIHLLNIKDRKKFIKNCFKQIKPSGYMVFTAISKNNPMFGKGKQLSTDRFQVTKGLNVFFYDSTSIKQEFEKYGLVEFYEMDEPIKHMTNEPPLKCFFIKCKKE